MHESFEILKVQVNRSLPPPKRWVWAVQSACLEPPPPYPPIPPPPPPTTTLTTSLKISVTCWKYKCVCCASMFIWYSGKHMKVLLYNIIIYKFDDRWKYVSDLSTLLKHDYLSHICPCMITCCVFSVFTHLLIFFITEQCVYYETELLQQHGDKRKSFVTISVCLSVFLPLSLCPSASASTCLSVCLSVSLSLSLLLLFKKKNAVSI